MQANTSTAERLHALAELYQQGQVSALMDRTLEKLLHHEAEQSQALLSQLEADLAASVKWPYGHFSKSIIFTGERHET